MTTVFTNGCFDLFHVGHVELFRFCKGLGDHLVVGINTDSSVTRLKGPSRPICPLADRMAVIAACRYVDEVLAFDEATPCELVRRLRPDILVKGPGYCVANMPEAMVASEYGGRVVIFNGPKVCSTDIVRRIIDICTLANPSFEE